jgi:hypothetical protein
MTDTSHSRAQSRQAGYPPEQSGWVGWVFFGGVMLMMMGGFQIIQGLVALFDDGFYLVRPNGLVVDVNYNAWGWTHLLIGIVAVLAGVGLVAGNMLARIVGVAAAFVSALVNLAFISAYPLWSSLVILLDVIVIYAIVVHGRELKEDYR